MTLPASGSISWNQICAEFGLNPATAVFPRDFYGKGGAPSSGPLSFADFYGRSAPPAITYAPAPDGYYQVDTSFAANSFTITASQPVNWTWSKVGTGITSTVPSGTSASSITFNCNKFSSGSISVNSGGNHWDIGVGDGGAV